MAIEKDITDEEMKAIEELRQRFEETAEPQLLEDKYFLGRFLAARGFNIDNAEEMLRKHMEWRKRKDIKNILKTYKKPEVIEKYLSYQIIGYDKEGCVVRFSPTGNIDFSGLAASLKHEELENLMGYEQELDAWEHKKKSKELGRNLDKVVYISDLKNISFSQITDKKVIHMLLNLIKIYLNNYPETLKAAYLINVPSYFTLVYSLLKSNLPSSIIEKIFLYSDDSYKEDILKVIDTDTLPAFLGGNKTDPDGNSLCLTFINHAGERVPESYYLRKNKKPLSKEKGVKKVTLSRAAFHEVNLEVKEPGSYLEWEFETKCRDIGFGLFYQEMVNGEEKITELVAIQRIDTEEYPETGTFMCEHAGTYIILFDNTYSWVRAKEIYYRAKVVTPKEHEAELKDS